MFGIISKNTFNRIVRKPNYGIRKIGTNPKTNITSKIRTTADYKNLYNLTKEQNKKFLQYKKILLSKESHNNIIVENILVRCARSTNDDLLNLHHLTILQTINTFYKLKNHIRRSSFYRFILGMMYFIYYMCAFVICCNLFIISVSFCLYIPFEILKIFS